MKKLIFLLLFVTFLKEIVWIAVVPIWHFPDEQSHFAQVAFIAETGRNPIYDDLDLTEEIRKSEELLGTERDVLGINKFTYHPEYRIEYNQKLIGQYESKIESLKDNPQARRMVKKEASRYHPFYYTVLGGIYRLLYQDTLINRVFVSRIFQSLLSVLVVLIAFKAGQYIFRNKFQSLTLATLVSFHPMFSFVSAGVNSDNLGTLLFSAYILITLIILNKRINLPNIVILGIISLLAFIVKPQYFIVFPLSIIFFAFKIIITKDNILKKLLKVFSLILFSLLLLFLVLRLGLSSGVLVGKFIDNFSPIELATYFRSYVIPHLYREVLPWYWGIFNWLGVTYPRIIHRIVNWLGLISVVGLVLIFIKNKFRLTQFPLKEIIWLMTINIFFVIGIYSYDFLEWSQKNIHLGVQGRYFFPAIISQMSLILAGLLIFIPNSQSKLKEYFTPAVSILMIIFNFYALFIVAGAYYDLSSLDTFIREASQYKPWFFKGEYLLTFWILYLVALSFALFQFLYSYERKEKKD